MLPLTSANLPLWRSLLFIPAHVERFIQSAPKRHADAIILDLEDSVPDAVKPEARKQLAQHISYLNTQSLDVLVRINRRLTHAIADLEASVTENTKAIIIPKAMGADHIRLLDEVITELENKRQLAIGGIKIIALIESISSLDVAKDIAQSSPRMVGLGMGTEDLSFDGQFEPTTDNLMHPSRQLVYAARLAKINAYGFPGSIADYSNIEHFTELQKTAKSMGFNGALCIHPSQVEAINTTYTVSASELEHAQKVVSTYQQAIDNNRGAVEVDKKMVDQPVVDKALQIIQHAKRFS